MVVTSGTDTARALQPYVPRVALRALAEAPGPHVAMLPGTLVFADVSGFTKLSERLARLGAEGAERISEAIETSFTSLLAVAYANGGGLLKFGGDALLLFFEGDAHAERALRTAVGMRRALRAAGPVVAPGARTTLRMSMGVHSGTLALCLAGRSHREPVVAGPAVTTTLRMEKAASAGEIVLSPSLAATLPARMVGAPCGPGLLLKAAPRGPDLAPAEPPLPAGTPIADGIPIAVRRHVLGGGGAPEHRLVTVAFVRYAGVDALVERAPDEAGAALDALLTVAQLACEAHEVALLCADGEADGGKLMLVAGAPRAVGDEEERMLLTLRAIADGGGSLPLQLGVNRGRAFTGDIGPDYRKTYTAMGDVTNLAARLAAKAPAGGIYATAGVLDRSALRFELTHIPPLTLKGKARPVEAWSVGAARGRERGGERQERPTLVGRDREFELLRGALAEVRGGEGRYAELAGPPGIGKTQLVEAMRAEAAGLTVLLATCEPHGGAGPYGAWRELLLPLIGADWDDPETAVVARLRAAVAERAHDLEPWLPLLAATLGAELPDTPAVAALAPAFRADRLHDAVVRFLAASLPDATVLVIEHAHDMDAASAALLGAVLDALPAHPWLILLTRRDAPWDAAPPPGPGRTALPLAPLAPEAALALAHHLTEDTPLPPPVLARATDRAAGNPQFLRDLLAAAAAGDDALTETLEAAATARIDRLDPRDRTLVRHAAVLGMSFHPRTLDDGESFARLGDIFAEDGGGWLRFRSGIVREAAYAGLPFKTRRRLHADAGAQLEAEGSGAPGERAGVLSLHFFRAGDHERAWGYAREAAERARTQGAHADAALLLRRALDAAKGAGAVRDDVADTWVALGEAQARSGSPDAAQAAYRRARALTGGDALRAGEVLLRETELADRAGRAPQAMRCGLRALRMLADVPGDAAAGCRARLLAALAMTRQRQGRSEEAIALCAQAIAEGERCGEDRAVAHACHILDWALHDAGRPEEATHSPRALAIYEQLGDLDRQAAVLNNLGAFAFHAGDWREAVVLYRRAANASAQAGDVVNAAFGDCNVGEVLVEQGRLTAADEALRAAVRVWRGTGDDAGVAYATAILGRAAVHQGRSEDGRGSIQRALAQLKRLGHEADAQMAEALLIEALVFGEHAEAALQQLEALRPRLLDGRSEPLLERLRGSALAQLGEWDAAAAALTASLDLARALEAPYDVAAALSALAAVTPDDPRTPIRRRELQAILEGLGVVRLAAPPGVRLRVARAS